MKKSAFIFIAILISFTVQGVAFSKSGEHGLYSHLAGNPLAGTYTIGTTGDYTTINDAIADLVKYNISDSVIFNIESGTYIEQVTIPAITGISSTNTITFKSATGNNTDVILTFSSFDVNTNYTLQFNSANYIMFKDITIKSTGLVYAKVIEMINGAAFNTIDNCIIQGVADVDNLVYVFSTIDDNVSNVFVNNVFADGQTGLRYLGANSTTGVEVRLNQFRDQTVKAMYVSYCYEPVIDGNEISSSQPIDGIFIQDTGIRKAIISNNKILLSAGGNGIVFEFELTGPSHAAEESLIYNNFIYIHTTSSSYGINVTPIKISAKIYYNTIHITGNSTGSSAYHEADLDSWSLDLKNNILVNEAFGTLFSGGNYAQPDYNMLYTNGSFIGYSAKTLTDWQTNYNKGLHSIFANPYFVSETSWQVQNPLVNGAALAVTEVTTDIDGEARDATTPDLGADEFTPAPVPLNGTYTIGGGSPDYTTINKAVEDVAINGVSGPVIFNIATGTYSEQVTIQEISGTSATNTVTFQSVSGDSTDVLIIYTPTNTTHTHTILLNGADYLDFSNLSISSGELWGMPVQLQNEATNNTFEGNRVFKASQPPFSWDYALIYSKGSADSSNMFTGNYFENGNMGIYLNGSGSGTEITNNHFANIFFQGIYLKNNQSPVITGNIIEVSTNLSFSYGIYLQSNTYDGTQKGIVANNMILMNTAAGGATGISTPGASYLSVIYNTVKVNSGKAFSGGSNTDIINNIFTSGAGSFVAEISDTTGCVIDYNLYYQPNSNYADMYYSTGYTSNLEQYGFDLHSFSREPAFISDNDLHTTDPWISNRGTPLTEITTDIDGDLRDSTSPDVGADEYTAATLFAGEYIIGPTGDFSTFTEAADSLIETGAFGPVTFLVQSGTYNEQFTLKEFPYAGVGDSITVTFKPQVTGDSTVILQYAGTASHNYVVLLDSADYISFEGITFKALDDTNSNIIYLAHGATHNSFTGNIFIGSPTSGPIIYAKSDAINDIDNHFIDNRFYNSNIAISLEGISATNQATGLMVTGNRFENQRTGAIIIHNQMSPQITENTILHIALIAEKWSGIFLGNCSSGLLVNNVVSFQSDQLSAGIALDNTDHTSVYNNNVYITGSASDSRCFNQENGSYSNALKNNILANEADGIVLYQSTDVSIFTSDYNNFYVTGAHFAYSGSYMDDLASWQTTTGGDQHSFVANPWFPSVTNLFSRIPMINGTAIPLVSVANDINGVLRDGVNPDIGAFEFADAVFVLEKDTVICKQTSLLIDAGAGYSSYNWNTGETSQTIQTNISSTADTWYRVTVAFNGIAYSDSIMVSYMGPIIDLADTAGFCQDASVVLLAGDGSDTYEWSTGSTDPNITVSAAGAYFVKVTDSQGCIARDTVEVIASTGPIVDLGADTSFCAGDTLSLDAGAGSDYTYLWNDHSTKRTIDVFESGQYSVTVTDQYGCDNSDDIVITENPLPNVDLGPDQIICNGFSATLDAGPGFTSYQWSDATGLQTTTVDASGNYTVTVWDGNGCANSDTVMVTVNPPFTPTLSSSGDELQVDYPTGTSYEWYVNQSYYSATTAPTLSPTQSGDYYVQVTDEFGCFGTTNTVTFIITGIEVASRKVFQIYPNPSDGRMTIHYSGAVNNTEVIILNTEGHIIYQKALGDKANGFEQSIDLSGFAKGVYLLRIGVNGHVYNQKLLIK